MWYFHLFLSCLKSIKKIDSIKLVILYYMIYIKLLNCMFFVGNDFSNKVNMNLV